MFFFFFKQEPAYEMRISDWSSDVFSSDLIARIAGTDVADMAVARLNPANALLEDISGNYADGLAEGRITEIQQATVERVLIDIANAQGGMERIKNTPLPNG